MANIYIDYQYNIMLEDCELLDFMCVCIDFSDISIEFE